VLTFDSVTPSDQRRSNSRRTASRDQAGLRALRVVGRVGQQPAAAPEDGELGIGAIVAVQETCYNLVPSRMNISCVLSPWKSFRSELITNTFYSAFWNPLARFLGWRQESLGFLAFHLAGVCLQHNQLDLNSSNSSMSKRFEFILIAVKLELFLARSQFKLGHIEVYFGSTRMWWWAPKISFGHVISALGHSLCGPVRSCI